MPTSRAQRYSRSHRALRAVLARATGAPLLFAAAENGKPYLPAVPELRFNLSRSHGMALIAVALDVDVGWMWSASGPSRSTKP